MLKFLTSLSFLYLFSISVMLLYGLLYYRGFSRNGYQRRSFPWVFLLVMVACVSFLVLNMHAPLSRKTFSNLDHHFLRHDGYRVAGSLELGRADTTGEKGNASNRFGFTRNSKGLVVRSAYSEEPFYSSSGGKTRLLSAAFPATGHSVQLQCDSAVVVLSAVTGDSYELMINGKTSGKTIKPLKRGQNGWNLFQDDTLFMNSGWYNSDRVAGCLRSVLLLRDDFSNSEPGVLQFFLSGRLFRFADTVQYDKKTLLPADLGFNAPIAENTLIGWGLGFPDRSKKQYFVSFAGNDSFRLASRYPVSYPLTEDPSSGDKREWVSHEVVKFLVADPRQIGELPAVFTEGFLFSGSAGDSGLAFRPVLLSYRMDKAHAPLSLAAKYAGSAQSLPVSPGEKLFLAAGTPGTEWEFSVINSFNWNFGNIRLTPKTWQWFLFGSLGFFFFMVFFSSWLKPAGRLSWVWQVLSCLVLLLLTTRFFLYWRYKSFPPYENLDLPSVQQLNSVWNFGIIVFAAVLLGIVFGTDLIHFLYRVTTASIRSLTGKIARRETGHSRFPGQGFLQGSLNRINEDRSTAKKVFWVSWVLVLTGGGILAMLSNYDPAVCRHLAIALILLYFVFTYVSCRFSPLVAPSEKSWWSISTGSAADLVISNPVKVLLSLSLLGLFSFIDIGFALLFFNFLLFNEAFLCINYSIAGLSAGSRKNAFLFGALAFFYLMLFVVNLVYGPYLFAYILQMPAIAYMAGYLLFALLIAFAAGRLLQANAKRKRILTGVTAILLFAVAFILFPKERIQEKAAMTKYRIDVLIAAPDKTIQKAFENGDGYEPVIRAAQNQWFINTFISSEHNPAVNRTGFHLLPHAPQNRGAKYNAQATDLVTSRFLIAEHGRWSVLLFALLLFLPVVLLASFYKLYPDFTNRINAGYAAVTTGFSVLNYLFITALLVILAATGRYIFFGQDLPFGSILSKQSVLFPSLLIIGVILLFRNIPLQQYPNPKKMLPGILVFSGLGVLLFLVKPAFNNNKEFAVADLAKNLDGFVRYRLQPLLDEIDTAKATRRLSIEKKDLLFVSRMRALTEAGLLNDGGAFAVSQVKQYSRSGFAKHLDPDRMLYLDLHAGSPRLAVNENYFHVEPPPHLQQLWRGNVYGDTTQYTVTLWDVKKASVEKVIAGNYTAENRFALSAGLELTFRRKTRDNLYEQLCLVNRSGAVLELNTVTGKLLLSPDDSFSLANPCKIHISGNGEHSDRILQVQPDAFMKNYYVNGSRFYYYPLGNDLIWARNFAESIAADFSGPLQRDRNVFISMDAALTDSLSARIKKMLYTDTAYKQGAEYAICIADGNGRLLAIPDHIKGIERPDPNDKAAFMDAVGGMNVFISQSELRRRTGNVNLLRMNPGPGSTLKPIVFSAIASQLDLDWDAFAAEGFSEQQQYFGGEKVGEYDFEKNNGRISSVSDYIRYSDNYYHSNLLLLGSYSRQSQQALLVKHFLRQKPQGDALWPWFSYKGEQYWLNGFENWPGYAAGKANFGSDSSFVSVGLQNNFGIHTYRNGRGFDRFSSDFDSALFDRAYRRSGFILPEYALFDQKGSGMNLDRPNEVFMSSFRGHVKGSSQVMIPPVKMLDAFGKLVSQNRNYSLTLDPYPAEKTFSPAQVENGVSYSQYLSLMKGSVFTGMREALFKGTASRLGTMLKNGAPWFYYAKTGTTGDDAVKAKSKLFTLIISKKDIADPGFNFRKNKFVIIYFTSQNGPAKQNEEFQAEIIRMVRESPAFLKYMYSADQ